MEVSCAQVKTAAMATVEMVKNMEKLIDSAPFLTLRVYAGMCCALAHGVLRWRDLLRSERIHLTADAIVGVAWRMKLKSTMTPWAALRNGLNGDDWAGRWVVQLSEAGLPGEDFVLWGLSRDLSAFRPRVASYSDGVNAMRYLLAHSGMPPRETLLFTLHSWRHLFPTAARQLSLPEDEQVEMGHWATGSSMPRRYDSMACVTELLAKKKVATALLNDWTIAEPGCVPAPPPAVSLPSAAPFSPEPVKLAKRAKKTITVSNDNVIKSFLQVCNLGSGKVHIWVCGLSTACSKWKCGSPSVPAENACFVEEAKHLENTTSTPYCSSCYSSRLEFLNLVEIAEEVQEDERLQQEEVHESDDDDVASDDDASL